MTFESKIYRLNRRIPIKEYQKYLEALNQTKQMILEDCKREILNLPYHELLILQSSVERWSKLACDPDLTFRRALYAKAMNLKRKQIMKELQLAESSVSNLFNTGSMPQYPGPYQLTIMFNHPYQLVNYTDPDEKSYFQNPEYFQKNHIPTLTLDGILKEMEHVNSIRGYVISDPQLLFRDCNSPITGRWVRTYPEFDYFEFHLNYEPVRDKALRLKILHYFPRAKYLVTTYRPFKPKNERAVWVILPKNENLNTYHFMLHELDEYRENTDVRLLN